MTRLENNVVSTTNMICQKAGQYAPSVDTKYFAFLNVDRRSDPPSTGWGLKNLYRDITGPLRDTVVTLLFARAHLRIKIQSQTAF